MSRISQIFQSSNSHENAVPATAEAAAAEGLVDSSPFDQLKPKVAEIVKEVIAEQEKLVSEVKKCNVENALRKIPVIPKLAEKLPEPIKNQIKKIIEAVDGAKKDINAINVEDIHPFAPPATPSAPISAAVATSSIPTPVQEAHAVAE